MKYVILGFNGRICLNSSTYNLEHHHVFSVWKDLVWDTRVPLNQGGHNTIHPKFEINHMELKDNLWMVSMNSPPPSPAPSHIMKVHIIVVLFRTFNDVQINYMSTNLNNIIYKIKVKGNWDYEIHAKHIIILSIIHS